MDWLIDFITKLTEPNKINFLKQGDLFRQPIRMRIERSVQGQKWDDQGGSFFGLISSIIIFIGVVNYSLDVRNQTYDGLLDIFSTQEVVNKFDEETNNLRMFDFNFLPSIEAALLISGGEQLEEFKRHSSSEIFDFIDSKDRFPKLNIEKLNKYVRFQVKVRSWEAPDGREIIFRTPMVPCTEEMFKANNFVPDKVQTQFFNKRICPDTEAMKEFWILRNGYTSSKDRRSFNVQAALCDEGPDCAPREDIAFLLDKLYFTFYVVEDNIQFGDLGEKPFLTVNKFHSQF